MFQCFRIDSSFAMLLWLSQAPILADVPGWTAAGAIDIADAFAYPCDDYPTRRPSDARFGTTVSDSESPFDGLARLGDTIALAAGTEIRSVADGVVVYSDHIPSWEEHWNLGNVVVIEHDLGSAASEPRHVSSVYAHLAHDRRVRVGAQIRRGQVIGTIGAARSEENGGYSASLHFGVHTGRYYQISPSWRRRVLSDARKIGLPFGPGDSIVKGDVELTRESETSVLVTFKESGVSGPLSLRVAHPSPAYTPTDIVGWCESHGERETVSEWLDPVSWIERHRPTGPPTEPPTARAFSYPCDRYLEGLRRRGSFGAYISRRSRAFGGSYHLAEDIWLDPGTEVRSVADGIVMYSDFSPTWIDDSGHTHWNLGNVIVIEHRLAEPADGLEHVCSVYVHLSADRRAQVGERVERSQLIGFIGESRSEENGRYPAHLHFGLHRGPYYQVSPAWEQDLVRQAKKKGLPFGPDRALVKGEIQLTRTTQTEVLVEFPGQEARATLSLLVGSTSPGYKPADIMGWCQGYGEKRNVSEWIRPSKWIRDRLP